MQIGDALHFVRTWNCPVSVFCYTKQTGYRRDHVAVYRRDNLIAINREERDAHRFIGVFTGAVDTDDFIDACLYACQEYRQTHPEA